MYNKLDEFCRRLYSWVYSLFLTKVPEPITPGSWEWIAMGRGEGKTTRLVEWATQKAESGHNVLWLSMSHQRSDWVSKNYDIPINVTLWPISRIAEALSGSFYGSIAVDDYDELFAEKDKVDDLLENRRLRGADICCTITKNR